MSRELIQLDARRRPTSIFLILFIIVAAYFGRFTRFVGTWEIRWRSISTPDENNLELAQTRAHYRQMIHLHTGDLHKFATKETVARSSQ